MNGWRPYVWMWGVILPLVGWGGDSAGINDSATMDKLFATLRQECSECRILKMELEEEEHGPIYQVKLLTRAGLIIKREYRATDLYLLQEKSGKSR